MSRTEVLVSADWVEAHLDDRDVVLVEVDAYGSLVGVPIER